MCPNQSASRNVTEINGAPKGIMTFDKSNSLKHRYFKDEASRVRSIFLITFRWDLGELERGGNDATKSEVYPVDMVSKLSVKYRHASLNPIHESTLVNGISSSRIE